MATIEELFPGGGEAGALIRGFDWRSSPLGDPASWPGALKALVRTLLNTRQPMLVWWGPRLIQFYNDAFRPSFGVGKHPAAMGQPARECWPEVWPVVGEQLERVVSRGDAIWNEDMLVPVFRNGKLDDAWWTYSYSPVFDDAGERAGVLVVCTETTAKVLARQELEAAQRELHEVFMQAPIPIAILTGPDHLFTLANPAYDALTRRRVIGKTLLQAFSETESAPYKPLLDRVFETGEPVAIREAELKLANMSVRYIDLLYHPYRGPDGAVQGVMALVNDVTDSVRGRRARDEFIAMLSHELRNPLAPISTATTLMRLRGDHHAKEREIIERQVAHLSRLVDDLLDVARIARGKIQLQRAPVELAEVISKAIETTSPLLEQNLHQLALDVPREGLLVDGDPVRLAQVIGNILTNAARYTPAGGRIEIRARREGPAAAVSVRDNGPGIAEALLPRVFELFVQGEQRHDRPQGGLGLGLALVKNLVALHGGTVAARNLPGGGAEFTVTLPALERADSRQEQQARPKAVPTAAVRHRVLLVDDNTDAADLLCELLRSIGHDVVVAHDGAQALEALRSFAPDVGLLDIGLPGMDGFELARRIRQQARTVHRLVALTGYGQNPDREAARSAGFDVHLTKPVDLDDLIAAIER